MAVLPAYLAAAPAAPPGALAAPPPIVPPAAQALLTPVPIAGPPGAVLSARGPFTDWRALDAENTLVIDTSKGRIVVELRPEFAPLAVARLKRLARTRLYDGLLFHRVIEGFIAQTGDPNNLDGGKSLEPDLPPEFTFRLGADIPRTIAARPQGETEGFVGASPYVAVDEMRMASSPDRRVSAWGAHCAGVMAMGHDAASDAGNSEFFFMLQTTRSLDRRYSVVGRVITGLDVIRTLNLGDPPLAPDRMVRVRVMADLPAPDRPALLVLNSLSPQFTGLIERTRALRGADFSICDVEPPINLVPYVAEVRPSRPAKARPRRLSGR